MSGENMPPVLTIDGPSGSGKGTISRLVAARLGWHFLDSGALYRAVGLAAARRDSELNDALTIAQLALATVVEFKGGSHGEPEVWVDGVESSGELRTEICAAAASAVAAMPEVRIALMEKQRVFRRFPGLVADGRDMGTVIFPDAQCKVFLTASAEERAERRYKQLREKGISVNLDGLLREILARDARDASRAVAPLKPATDAVTIDSTGTPIDQVVAQVLAFVYSKIST